MRQYLNLVFGNDETRASLGKSIETASLSHAIILEGDRGSGKHTLAKEIAMATLCENKNDPRHPLPCRVCRACHMVDASLAPDIHYISRKDKATLGVDAVREMIDDTVMSSVEFDAKLYIFEDAETMTAQAQNALLKIMEEPPPIVKILLLTESADSLLTTVRSRARTVRMQRFTAEEIEQYLQKTAPNILPSKESEKEETRALLLSAGGSIGRAIELLSPQSRIAVKKEREEIIGLLNALTKKSYAALLSALLSLTQKRDELSRALLLLHTAIRDLILLKRAEAPQLCFFTKKESISEEFAAFRIGVLFAFADAIEETISELEKNANIQASVTALAARLRNIQKER